MARARARNWGGLNGPGLMNMRCSPSNVDAAGSQKDPEKYRNLVVRIAGYSAYFVDLSPMQQAEIIARAEERVV